MIKLSLVILLIWICICPVSSAGPYYRLSGLVNIPTAYILPQGIFNAGVHTAIRDQKRDELGFKVYFGMLNFTEFGLMEVRKNRDYIIGHIKMLIIREIGPNPGVSIGFDNIGEKIQDESGIYQRSIYGVISKQFNLPFLHFINGHLGVGNRRYSAETNIGKYLHGIFLGLDKKFQMPFLSSQLRVMCELDGRDVNAGLQYLMDTGLSVDLATGNLSSAEDIEFYFAISFTNENIMKKIDQSMELAKRAVRIANEASSDIKQ